MSTWFAAEDSIRLRRVRLHGAGDGLHARRRLEQALAPADGSVPGLPGKALLVVRRVTADLRSRAASGNAVAQRLRLELGRQASAARRPWLHADAAAADAVVFTDEAEMLACLVRDWLRGVVAQRWWWRSVLDDAPPAPWLRRQVLARGEVLVPVAVRLIEGASSSAHVAAVLEAWFARLDDAEAQEALGAVERAFALASLPMPSPVNAAQQKPAGDPAATAHETPDAQVEREDELALRALVSFVPELRASALGVPQRRLFAQVLAVVRAPSWARTPQLARALSHIERTAVQVEPIDGEMAGTRGGAETSAARSGTAPDADAPPVAAPHRQRPPRRDSRRAITRTEPHGEHRRDEQARAPTAAVPQDHTLAAAPLTPLFDEPLPDPAPPDTPARTRRDAPPDVALLHAAGRDIHTEFGGIFYLLNAALALGLYGDFTMPRARGLALSPWDWLALVGRAWFGAAFVRDPVWQLLAALAGRRASQAPGRGFDAPTAWAIDPSWIVPWGPVETLSVHATASHLCVRHAAGFLVFDVPRDAALKPMAQARALCAAQDALRGATLTCMRPRGRALPRPGTARWVRWMLAYLDARLALTLGAEAGDDVPALVCRHPARITTSASDVDVALQLADLPLSVRIAGLDRDPGWIPAAGRNLRFRFA